MIRFTRFHALCVALVLLVNVAAAQVVAIPDPNLEQLVRDTLELPNDVQIERGHMLQLRYLDAGGDRGIVNRTGLEYATNIVTLSLYHNPIDDISPLASMTKMTGFNLWGCRVVDLSPLRNLQNLSWIVLGNNQISDISPLAGLVNLTTLQVDSNQIVDISPLSNLTQLEELRLNRNAITDIASLIKLNNLKKLYLADNPFHDFSPLLELEGVGLDIEISEEFNAIVEVPDPNFRLLIREALSLPETVPLTQGQMQRLTKLDAGGDRGITDLTGLEYATNLQFLWLYHNPIVDISPLARLTKLEGFHLWGCRIADLRPLGNLNHLRWIVLGNNQISDLSPLAGLINLTALHVDRNQIVDISPLTSLTRLEELRLNRNAITDITPLTKLKNLQKLHLADNPFHDFSPLFELEGVELDIEISEEFNAVVDVPDPTLRQLIREALSLPETVPLTQGQMQRLTQLDSGGDRGIANLTGLEYATNLRYLGLYGNPIVEIGPLTHLTKLEGLNLWECRIVDLSPLRNLKNLRRMVLGNNQITDISALAGLTNLTELLLNRNQIMDFSPLANLGSLETLWIQANPGNDFSALDMLSLTVFRFDEVCDIPPLFPLEERLNNRSYPSVVRAWDDVVGQNHLSQIEKGMLHDLWFDPAFYFEIRWDITPSALTPGLATQLAVLPEVSYDLRRSAQQLNPDTIILKSIPIYDRPLRDTFPPDSHVWLRDTNGEIVKRKVGAGELRPMIDIFVPEVQNHFIDRIVAIEQCGVYDGVFLDEFYLNGTGWVARHLYDATDEEIIQVWVNILEAVRAQTRDDFLILMNVNHSKPTRFAKYVNGVFMESFRDHPGGYSREWIMVHEDTLSWAENNLREPRINCLYGAGMDIEPPDGPNNLRWMRMFTTLSLTHSNGYVIYTDGQRGDPSRDAPLGTHHAHLWYGFWNADIGQPVGPKAQLYEKVEGLFIREFTKGWAVYNRSGKPHVVTLPERVQSVRSGLQHTQHAVPDLDGDMFLRIAPVNPAHANGDGVTNILDLVLVAQSFGTNMHDVNGDCVTNVLDLVIVAQAINQ